MAAQSDIPSNLIETARIVSEVIQHIKMQNKDN